MNNSIALIVKEIIFNRHSICYRVKPKTKLPNRFNLDLFPFYSEIGIKDKDLIAKPSLLCFNNSSFNDVNDIVVFKTHNVTPQFYESLVKKIEPNASEYSSELDSIYGVGDVVGYILIS
tara:strand:- start:4162 stop:4518 length:357 start_codon:yes stop_codon:yes gene_type:complete